MTFPSKPWEKSALDRRTIADEHGECICRAAKRMRASGLWTEHQEALWKAFVALRDEYSVLSQQGLLCKDVYKRLVPVFRELEEELFGRSTI